MKTLKAQAATLAAAAGLLALAQAPAAAQGTPAVTLIDRVWIQNVSGFAGMGIAAAGVPCTGDMDLCSVSGSMGSQAPLSGLSPGTVTLAGSASAFDTDGQFWASFDAQWSLQAGYTLAQVGSDAVLQASTRHDSEMLTAVGWSAGPPVLTDTFSSLNFQRLRFTLDAPASFSITGSVWGEYNPILLRKDDGQGSYIGIGLGAVTSESSAWFDAHPGQAWTFAGSGSLSAGTYWIENFTLAATDSEAATPWRYGQAFTLTLHDTLATPVPEPAALSMMIGGLLALRLLRAAPRR